MLSIKKYLPLIIQLVLTDLIILKRTILGKIIDLIIWIVTMILVTAYLMPKFGLSQEYTGFIIASTAASAGLFELYGGVTNIISDFEGNNITSFYLTLPLPSWLVFIKNMIFYTINTAILGIIVVPICKLMLWNRFDLSEFSMSKYVVIFILTNIFYAAFTLWTTSYTASMEVIGSIWMRFVYPLWFLGGYQYSWYILNAVWPNLAIIGLINPLTYIMEASRAAILGQEGSLDFWPCCAAIIAFTILMTCHSIYRLKKRLDFI